MPPDCDTWEARTVPPRQLRRAPRRLSLHVGSHRAGPCDGRAPARWAARLPFRRGSHGGKLSPRNGPGCERVLSLPAVTVSRGHSRYKRPAVRRNLGELVAAANTAKMAIKPVESSIALRDRCTRRELLSREARSIDACGEEIPASDGGTWSRASSVVEPQPRRYRVHRAAFRRVHAPHHAGRRLEVVGGAHHDVADWSGSRPRRACPSRPSGAGLQSADAERIGRQPRTSHTGAWRSRVLGVRRGGLVAGHGRRVPDRRAPRR